MRRNFLMRLLGQCLFPALVLAQNPDDFKQPYPLGAKLSEASAKNFIGQAYIAPITSNKELNVPMSNVTFEPSCRNNWHYHKKGQILVASAGIGYYQEKGKPARRLYPGDIVEIAPDVIHWHGAAPDSWFAHIAVSCNPQTNQVVWLDPVEDNEYLDATSKAENVYAEANNVLEARERAIVAIASYTGKGDLEHLALALQQGLESGMTINEIKEVLIHAYAYCGFPRSLRAIQTFMRVVEERKAMGIKDVEGREASLIKENGNKYERGRDILAEISGVSASAPKTGYAVFAPTIERFLKEHLFADLFERDLLTYRERELATVSILAGVGGVEPMAYGHMSICLHLGITPGQLTALLNIVEINLGKNTSDPFRSILEQLTDKK
ncbi:cupin domain-containing carboxymuconolactone decarboxylase family protein [Parabacteroides sp.]